jgi:hypothetical protein
MTITVRIVLIVLAIICFALAAAGVPSKVNLTALGLALWALGTIVSA